MGPRRPGSSRQKFVLDARTRRWTDLMEQMPPFVAVCHHAPIDGEFLYTESSPSLPGPPAVFSVCEKALEHGLEWVLVGQARAAHGEPCEIPPVFKWHREAAITFVYLHDLSPGVSVSSAGCKWFSNPWALPALLGSSSMKFFDKEWNECGDVGCQLLSQLCGIPTPFFGNPSSLKSMAMADLISWVSKFGNQSLDEQTSALICIGAEIFPTLKSLGRCPFNTLQLHILEYLKDFSVLAWESDDKSPIRPVLTDSISDFRYHAQEYPVPSAISVVDGWFVVGGDLDVSAVYSEGEDGVVIMELYPPDGSESDGKFGGIYVRLRKVGGAFARAFPHTFQPRPEPSSLRRGRIRLRRELETTTSNPLNRKLLRPLSRTPTTASTTRHSPRPVTSFPANSQCFSHDLSPSVSRKAPMSKRTLTESYATETVASTRAAQRQDEQEQEEEHRSDVETPSRKRTKMFDTVPPAFPSDPPSGQTAEVAANEDPDKLQVCDLSVVSDPDHEVEALGPAPLVAQVGYDMHKDAYEIFHDMDCEVEKLPDDHAFSPSRPEILQRGWDRFVASQTWVGSAHSGFPSLSAQSSRVDSGFSEPMSEQDMMTKRSDMKYFSCPFYAFHPDSNKACLHNGGFGDLRAINLHLARHHRIPEQCPRCHETFESEDAEAEHLESDCQIKPAVPKPLGVAERHLSRLCRLDPRVKTDEDQWWYIYDVLLGQRMDRNPAAASPYFSGKLEDVIITLHQFWGANGQSIISDVLFPAESNPDESGLKKDQLGEWKVKDWGVADEERALKLLLGEIEGELVKMVIAGFENGGS